MAIKEGDKVKVHYTGTLEDGTVFDDSNKHGKPLEFEVGKGMVIPGFEKGIMGMEAGEEKDIKIGPEEAYGDHNPDLIKTIPRDSLPAEPEPQAGMMLMVGLQNGQQIPAKITEVKEGEITIDLNPPLAGQTLNFKLKIESIESA